MPASEVPTVVCAWCRELIRDAGSAISHGICDSCARNINERTAALPPDALKPRLDLEPSVFTQK